MYLNRKLDIYILFVIFGSTMATQVSAAPSDCRTAALPDGTPALFCKDKKGNWRQQAGKVESAPVSASSTAAAPIYVDAIFQGPAVYKIPIEQRQRRNRDWTDLILNGTQPKTRDVELFVTIVMRIEGEKITGTSSGGNWSNVPFTGIRKGGICSFASSFNGSTVATMGKCDASGFMGTLTEYRAVDGASAKGTFSYSTINFEDTSQRDSQRAELKAKCDGGESTSACVELDQLK